MVKKLCKFFGYSVFFIVALIYFTPKVSLYYFLETKLNQLEIVIGLEEALDNGFTLGVKHQSVYYKSIQSATIKEAHLKIFMLYNALNFKDITLSSVAKSFFPLHIENATIQYTLFNPLYIQAVIDGEFGKANARYSILKKTLHIELLPSDLMLKSYMNTLKNMQKNKEGEYSYDTAI